MTKLIKPDATPFQAALRLSILKYIKQAIADGATGMSVENLRQRVSISPNLDGAPRGTNAGYTYTRIFCGVCEDKAIKPFIIAARSDL